MDSRDIKIYMIIIVGYHDLHVYLMTDGSSLTIEDFLMEVVCIFTDGACQVICDLWYLVNT